ncbi:OmpA family protein [Fulvivirgaceae bacterium PWU4]|uniref:OmpA family protein n=1 Tax=Chryseosolibacter histidini TaxID=2782349 RepID=A0AAP2GQC2_9BACT|nr:OmpA family protein [Chryseosolibacter histidini]MBT1698785.1 OmpA family protein [Chryseosolibacter histidini]
MVRIPAIARRFLSFIFLLLLIALSNNLYGQETPADKKKTGVNIMITQSPKILVKVEAVTNNNCAGDSKGAINVTPYGGFPPYKYQWSSGDTTQDIAGLKAGMYKLIVSDNLSCSDTVKVTITSPDPLNGKIESIKDILCYGYDNGEVNLSVAGGKAPYSYHWSNGAQTQDLTGVTSGRYSVLITDASGCQEIIPAEVQEKPLIVRWIDDIKNIRCNGDSTGSIDINVSGGVPPYTYQWSNGARTEDIRGLKAGDYEVVVKDSKACTEVSLTKVTAPAPISIAFDEVRNLRCFGDQGGVINVSVKGGSAPYQYAWNNGANTQDITGLNAGNYTLNVSDHNGCKKTVTTTITEPAALAVNLVKLQNVMFNGGNNGSVDIAVNGGVPPYKYRWNNGTETQDLANLVAGNYSVRVADATGCAKIMNVSISQPSPLVVRLDDTRNISCNGAKTGEVNITVTGGVSPYTFAWSNGQTVEDISALPAGKYAVTVTDANGFKQKVEATLTEPPAFKAKIVGTTNILCNGQHTGAIDITADGGVQPYRYRWSSGQTTQDLSNVPAGSYTVKIIDANSCEQSLADTITQPKPLALEFQKITHINCNGANTGKIDISVDGGIAPYSYAWNNGAQTQDLNDIKAGEYNVKVADSKGCGQEIRTTITEPPLLVVKEDMIKNIDCNSNNTGSISLNVFGGVTPYNFAWNNGSTTRDIAGIKAGSYSLKVTDANGCTNSYSKVITEPTPMVEKVAEVKNILCFDDAKGAVNIDVTGGVQPYKYKWSNGAVSQDIIDVKAGRYSVLIIDANNCTDSLSATITQNPLMVPAVTATNIKCFGEKTGAVNLTVQGGVGPFVYKWTNNAITQNITGLSAGKYSALITDSKGCSKSIDALVIEPSKFVATLEGDKEISCFGEATGYVNVKVSGGTTPYKYKWNNGDTTLSISKVPAGVYSLLATDRNGCTQNVSTTLSQPTKIERSVKSITNVSCFGDNSGAIDIVVSGGIGPYAYKWSNAATTQDLDGVPAGKYNVTLTDANNCSTTLDAEITQPTQLSVKIDTVTNIACYGDKKGVIKLSVSGGVQPYIYSWSNGAVTKDIADLPAGNYSVTVTDAKGCFKVATAKVTEPPVLVASVKEVKHISCFGDQTGAISIEVAGGVQPYAYKWSNGKTTQNLSGIVAGSYTVEISDKNGCKQTLSAVITQPTKMATAIASVKNASCFNGKDGSVDIVVNGGKAPYQYSWSNKATTQDIVDLPAGTYTVQITDANGCKDSTLRATIKHPAELAASITKVVDVLKYGDKTGSIDLAVSGGVAPYTYSWSNGAVTQSLKAIPGGNYSVIITDANKCEKVMSATIKQPPALDVKIASIKDITCNGQRTGAITVNVSGGSKPYKYVWSNGDSTQNLNNVPAGDYSIKVIDANGYHQTVSTKIAQPSPLTAKLDNLKTLACFNDNSGAAGVTVTGGMAPYKFAWSSGQSTEDLKGVPAGNYTLTVTDNAGCVVTLQADITQPQQFAAKVTDVDHIKCKGESQGAIQLEVTGGVTPYNYYWSNGVRTKDITKARAGQYTVKVADANGCISNVSTNINEPSQFTAKIASVTDNLCFGERNGAVKVDVGGGTLPYRFRWSNGDTTQNLASIAKGEYSVTITDANQCLQKLSASISEPVALALTMKQLVNVSCFAGKTGDVNIDVTGGTKPYSYMWNNGAKTQNLTDVAAGDYELAVKDAKGCTKTIKATVLQPDELAIRLDTIRNVSCFGDSKGHIEVSVTGGALPYTYVWSNGASSEDLSNAIAGRYTLQVEDSKGCTKSMTATIEQPTKLEIKADPIAHIKCSGEETGSVSIAAAGGTAPYRYLWSNGTATQKLVNVAAGEYTANVSDANGCLVEYTARITEPVALIKTIDAITDIRCSGDSSGSVHVTVREGVAPYSFKWSHGATTEDATSLVAGNYKLTITEGNGCKSMLEANIEQPSKFVASVEKITDILCHGNNTGAIDIKVSGGVEPHTFAWSNGNKLEDLKDLTADSYSVVVADANGCSKTLNAEVKQPELLALRIDSVRNVKCCGDTSGAIFISVSGGVKPYAYLWSNGATTEDIRNLVLGVYTVNVTDANGCVISSLDDMSLYEEVVSRGKFTTRDINFDIGKATIKTESFNTINRIASFMKEHPDVTFRIEGHTDSDGSDESNRKLSEDRAYAIRAALIKFGIRENRLQAKGWGESKPIATNLTVEGRTLNRRVEFVSLTGTNDGTLMLNEINGSSANTPPQTPK